MLSSSDLSALRVARAAVLAPRLDGYDLQFTVMTSGLVKEAQPDCCIPFRGQQDVNGLTRSIDRVVQRFPLPSDFDGCR